ncbi:uncharacterized protein BX664DRAFT_332080 [Halteromyces radiatus]|uniref:uncharacterized protein n=1 Tax=Halteromyces radiatus TaxID=101107 RepID=UPI0022207A64|nr:uncharacterized protein BX664DRAFT_332080 [Halteromyces radiatus]KAI8089062.1 hypothetical protein BX664DRAFT_332080 [Halteromyces radiatus]
MEQKQSLADHSNHHDPIIQHLYRSAKRILQNQVTADESMVSYLLHVVEDAETRYDKTIGMLDDDVQDTSAKKRTIGYMKEGMNLLRTCKRQYISSRSSSPTPLSTIY